MTSITESKRYRQRLLEKNLIKEFPEYRIKEYDAHYSSGIFLIKDSYKGLFGLFNILDLGNLYAIIKLDEMTIKNGDETLIKRMIAFAKKYKISIVIRDN